MSVCPNGAAPMFLEWGNISVNIDQTLARGIQIGIGTPQQIVALTPSANDNDLYVVNKQECGPSYNDSCAGQYGGLFDSSASTSYTEVTQAQWNGTAEPNPKHLSFIYFNDDISFGNAAVDGFPAFMDQPGYGGQGSLPLGWNSTFLNAAIAQNASPSRYWSLWPGSRSIDYGVPGELVLGGVDLTRFEPQTVATFQSEPNCTLCPIVTGLSWDTDNGSFNIFSNASDTLQISLQPDVNWLTVTPDMFANFANATGASLTLDPGALAYDAAHPPVGNLTVTLRGGYQTHITSADLFVYPRGYINGTYSVTNNTFMVAEILAQNNTGFVRNWGVPFLTFNYLMVDYAKSQFQLAPAIRTDFSNQGGGYQLSAVCDPVTTTAPPSRATSSGPPVSPATTTSAARDSGSTKGGSDTGAIIGGVVGGVLGLILIVGGLALLFYRSRRRSKAASVDAQRDPMSQRERTSQYTAYTGTTPRGAHEVSSATKSNPDVESWINSAGSDATPSANLNTSPHPFEMPSEHY